MELNKNLYEYQKVRGLKRKLHLIDLRGGSCERCGYNKNLASFDFHHKDPNEKESQLDMRKLSNSTMKWILDEFEKCEVLCANCHREEHSPDLLIGDVREMLEKYELDKILKSKEYGKPKCVDCGCEINYTHKRCHPCNSIFKRNVDRPDMNVLLKESEENGYTWCGKKYGVSRTTIKRWLKII